MFSVSSLLGQLAASLLQGEGNFIAKMVGAQIESAGTNIIKDLISQSVGFKAKKAGETLGNAILFGSPQEFKRARDQWLNAMNEKPLTGSESKLSEQIQKSFQIAAREQSRPEQGHWKWSKSRNDWLNEDWKHDWRSQPRDKLGRWIPGRLKHIYVSTSVKKSRSARRRAVRKQVKEMFRGGN